MCGVCVLEGSGVKTCVGSGGGTTVKCLYCSEVFPAPVYQHCLVNNTAMITFSLYSVKFAQ